MNTKIKEKRSKKVFIAVFILPSLLGYCIFVLYPMLKGMFYSFYDWSGVTSKMRFIGLGNYKNLLIDPYVVQAFKNEFIIIFWKILLIISISLFFALVLTRSKLRSIEKSFYRIVFFFPNILSIIIIANIWSFTYHPTIGLLNSGLTKIGLASWTRTWLGDPIQ